MDYFFLVFNDTKERIEKRYGVSVEKEANDPKYDETDNEDIVTQVICYYKKNGKIGCFSWCGVTVLIDDDNIQARKEKICSYCGKERVGKECVCGSTEFEKRDKDYEYIKQDIETIDGIIPATSPAMEDGQYLTEVVVDPMFGSSVSPTGELVTEEVKMEQTKIPYFYPDIYPVSIRKNVSIDNTVFGSNDMEVIESQQIAIDKLLSKCTEKVLKAGSIVTKKSETDLEFTDEVLQPVNIENPDELNAIKVVDISVNPSSDIDLAKELYYIAKSQLGVSDTFQGKQDNTATSGVAKQAQIQQAQGRLKSKQVMKNECYRRIYKLIFLYTLAYCDDPVPYPSEETDGKPTNVYFNKYDFLETDEYGNYYWDTDYIFDVDQSGFDTNDTNAIMQFIQTDFEKGMYGDPADPETQLYLWQLRSEIGYPYANRQVERWKKKVEEMKQMQELQQQMAMNPIGQAIPPQTNAPI
jgi:hypothetical protein